MVYDLPKNVLLNIISASCVVPLAASLLVSGSAPYLNCMNVNG